MKGTILINYSSENDNGYISGDDGKGYTFNHRNWLDTEVIPKKGLRVDFDIEGNNAKDIFALPDINSNSTRSSIYENFVERKDKIFAEVKNNDSLKNIYSKVNFFWHSTIYPFLKYFGKKLIHYFDNLTNMRIDKQQNGSYNKLYHNFVQNIKILQILAYIGSIIMGIVIASTFEVDGLIAVPFTLSMLLSIYLSTTFFMAIVDILGSIEMSLNTMQKDLEQIRFNEDDETT
jgi:hypothetical protein